MSDRYEQEAQHGPVERGALEGDDGGPPGRPTDEPGENGLLQEAQGKGFGGDEGERDGEV